MDVASKVEKLVKPQASLHVSQCESCVTIPGENHAIDMINPITLKTWYGGKTISECISEHPGAEVMTVDELCRQVAERQHTPIVWQETTREDYEYGMNVLPPIMFTMSSFMVSEAWDHDASNGQPRYQAYRQRGDKYEKANRPMTREEFKTARVVA